MNGAFITVEGTDGSGKTTHIDFIHRWLEERGAQVVRTREPGGTALGELLREILLRHDEVPRSSRAELLLFFAVRAQHLDEVIVPALEAGKWVLCDRFADATYAYQGGGRGIATKDIEALEQSAQVVLQPDLTVLFDVPPTVGRGRVLQKDLTMLDTPADGGREAADRFEKQTLDFNTAVRKAYKQRAARFKRRIKMIDAAQTIEQVRAELKTVLETFRQQHESRTTADDR